ncbi:MAG: response regulator [Bacteroidales bacterium]|nr:response regulator [Bacteroidales bacterium]
MKKLTLFAYLIFVLILGINAVYYNNLYQKQLNYIVKLLSQQVQLIGSEVGETNLYFESDINKIFFGENMEDFFSDEMVKSRVIEKLKFFYTKYDDFVVNITMHNTSAEVFSLYRDIDSEDAWIGNTYLAQNQREILESDMLKENRERYDFYLPYLASDGTIVGNMVVTVDYIKYFNSQFAKYKLEDYQWQWMIGPEGEVIYNNYYSTDPVLLNLNPELRISGVDQIAADLRNEISGNRTHRFEADGIARTLISCYHPVTLLKRNFGLVFSAPTDFYQKYIIRNSLLIVTLTLVLVHLIIIFFRRYIRRQNRTETTLKSSEQTMIDLIERLPVGVIITTSSKEVIRANSSAASMFSYNTQEEMKGKLMPENLHSGEGLYFAENLGQGSEGSQFMVIEKEGADMILYRKEIPVNYLDEKALMIVLIDVTLLEVARKQEARANEAKSEFLARMSHEIRTPLNGIIGMTDILSGMNNRPEVSAVVNLIKNSSDLLMRIINDLLDFSRIESGKLMLDEIPFDARKEIAYCVDVAGTLLNDDVTIKWAVDDNVSGSLVGDPFRLRQALTNLLITSVEHTSKGVIDLKCTAEEESHGVIKLIFDLRDTGAGYSSNLFKRLFGDYLTTETKSINEYEGKGLTGLISRQIIEMMGGTLEPSTPSGLSDNPETPGARFHFYVKVYSNVKQEKNDGASEITKYSEIKTLVVSGTRHRDEELMDALHKFGLSAYVTSWQNQTISMVKANLQNRQERYRMVVILDTPDFDGFEVARELWESNLYSEFMILMVSSNDKRGNYSRSIRYGVDEYLVQPFHLSELFNMIQNHYHGIEVPAFLIPGELMRKDLRILVAEDNVINQKVALTLFRGLGYEADIAANGREAVEKCRLSKYDIVFMDLIMPVMDGFDAASAIIGEDADIIVVALTADGSGEAVRKAELCGMHHFVSKPVRQEDIKKILLRFFAQTVG